MKKPTPRAEAKTKRLHEVAKLYEKYGTAAGVGEALGISKQGATYLLLQADEAGIVNYKRRAPITVTKAQARKSLKSAGGIAAAAEALGVSIYIFRTRWPDLVDEAKAKAAETRSTPLKYRNERAIYIEKRRKIARKDGICIMCFMNEAGEGRVTCVTCSAKVTARRAKSRK